MAIHKDLYRKLAVILLASSLIVVPFFLPDYFVFQATIILVYACAVLGLNILVGYNGQISLGHGAFYAIGAYSSAIAMEHFGIPYVLAFMVAGILCFICGFLMGFPAMRLGGIYLALATFALAVAIPQLLKHEFLEDWTGGVQGILLFKPTPPVDVSFLGVPLSEDRWFYLVTLVIVALLFWAASNLVKGRIGRSLIAIRDHPVAASAMGVNLPIVKSLAFGVSAAYTGIAGALGAVAVGFISPDSFHGLLSITLLVGAVVGGLATIHGAIFGAIFLAIVPNIAESVSRSAPSAIYGVLLIVLMLLMPSGIAGYRKRARTKSTT